MRIARNANWCNVTFVMKFRFGVVNWSQWRLSIWTREMSLCREGLPRLGGFLKVFRSRSSALKTTWCSTLIFISLSINPQASTWLFSAPVWQISRGFWGVHNLNCKILFNYWLLLYQVAIMLIIVVKILGCLSFLLFWTLRFLNGLLTVTWVQLTVSCLFSISYVV